MSTETKEGFSKKSFWKKISGLAKKTGKGIVGKALVLYYCLGDSDTPVWAKTVIVGALGYFISLVDAIPDLIPVGGYTDDTGVLVGAIATVAAHIKKEHKDRAENNLNDWIGD